MDGRGLSKIENFKRIYGEANILGHKINTEKGKIRYIILYQEELYLEKAKLAEMKNNPQPNNPNYIRDLRSREESVKLMEKRVDHMQVSLLMGLRKVKREIEDHITNLERVIAKSRQMMVTPPPEEEGLFNQVPPAPGTPEAHLVRAGFAGPAFNFDPGYVQKIAQGQMQDNAQGNVQGMAQAAHGNPQWGAQPNVQGNLQANYPAKPE